MGLLRIGFSLIREHEKATQIQPYEFFIPYYISTALFSLFLLKMVVTAFGFLLLIIPGLYLLIALQFALPLYIEYYQDDFTLFSAFKYSRIIVHRKFIQFTIFYLVTTLGAFSGLLFFGIGIFASLPISALTVCYAFKDIYELRDFHIRRLREGHLR